MVQQGPNPIEVYEAAAQIMVPTIGAITAAQHTSSTPCSNWNVQALINHNIKVQAFANSLISGSPMGDPTSMFDVDGPLPAEGGEAAFKATCDALLATAKSADLEKIVETPFGPMPAGNFIFVPMADMVLHRWDLAKATNQNTNIETSLAEVCLGVLSPEAVAGGRDMGFFGPEVTLPANASVQDRLLGLTGRQP